MLSQLLGDVFGKLGVLGHLKGPFVKLGLQRAVSNGTQAIPRVEWICQTYRIRMFLDS